MLIRHISALFIMYIGIATFSAVHANTTTYETKEKTMMDQQMQFTMLTQLSGEAYLFQRNALLSHRVDVTTFLPLQTNEVSWQHQIQAQILTGWQKHHLLYTSIIKELGAVDAETESKTAIGISRIWDKYALKTQKEYHEDILPLAWEVVLKLHEHWPDWKVITFLHILAAEPNEASVAPTIWLLENTLNDSIRDAAGFALSKLPKQSSVEGMQSLTQKHISIQSVIDEALYEMNDD